MLKNCRGFSLIEVLSGFSLLIILVSIFIPQMLSVYHERQHLEHRRFAQAYLNDHMQIFLYENGELLSGNESIDGQTYTFFNTTLENHLSKFCIQWIEKGGGRAYEKCTYGKRLSIE